MAQKAFAVGDFIINDWEGTDDTTASIASVLRGGAGLPGAVATPAGRTGRWPLISSLRRGASKLTLETHYLTATPALRYAQMRNLINELNPETETPIKLFTADQVAPEGLLFCFGPWNVYPDSSGDWFVDSILGIATGTITSGDPVNFQVGQQSRQRALAIEESTTNLVTNPSVETNTTNWAQTGGATIARTTSESKYGAYSLSVTCNGAAANEGARYASVTGLTGGNNYAGSVWVKAPVGATLALNVGDPSQFTQTSFTGTGDWQWITAIHTLDVAETTAQIDIYTLTTAQDIIFYVDGLQLEDKDYNTTYADGTLGDGYAWTGTEHASTSTRDANEFNLDAEASLISTRNTMSFRFVVRALADSDADWPAGGDSFLMDAYSSKGIGPRLWVSYDPTAQEWQVYINGANRLTAAASFSEGDWIDVVVTLDFTNNSYALYIDGTSVDTDVTSLNAPTVEEWNLGSTRVVAGHGNWWFAEFAAWDRVLNTTEVTALNTNGTIAGRARWLEVLCEAAQPLVIGQSPSDKGTVSTLTIHDDVRWQGRDGDVHFWGVYDSPYYFNVDVDSDDDIYPIIRIKPITAKTAGNGYGYKRWTPIQWRSSYAATRYPLLAELDTATLFGANKIQGDLDDLRVWSDGVEVDRWFDSAATAASTNIWFNLNFASDISLTLDSAVSTGSITELALNESLTNVPYEGIVLIDSEAFTFTSKNNTDRKLLGVTRATKGTATAAHAADTAVAWIQHDVWTLYGNSAAAALSVDNDYKPIFELDTSSNTSWIYQEFGDDKNRRSGGWREQAIEGQDGDELMFYTANRVTDADPWEELGIQTEQNESTGLMFLYNPCFVSTLALNNGEKWSDDITYWTTTDDHAAHIVSSADGSKWSNEYSITAPSTASTWQAWNRTETITANRPWVGMRLKGLSASGTNRLEAADCTATFNSTYTPTVTLNAEQTNYDLSATLENTTTGDAIAIDMQMQLSQTLEIDTAARTVTLLNDGGDQTAAVTFVGGARNDWLALQPGLNLLTWTDAGTQEVEISIYYNRRDWE